MDPRENGKSLSQSSVNSQPSKETCPFGEKCYRKNPVHFSEMSHPHLEALLEDQLDDNIILPQILSFISTDRSQLMDQLKVLQMVLRKEKGMSSLSNTQVAPVKRSMPDLLESPVPKKNKEHQLPESPFRAKEPVKYADSGSSSPVKSQDSEKEKNPSRSQSPSPMGLSQPSSTASESSTFGATSIFEQFHACSTQQSREELRKTALMKMMRSGQKVPHTGSRGEFDMKYVLSSPYYVFLTAVQNSVETWSQNYSITFPEILDTSLGEIEESLHINFMVDVGWLCLQYLLACQSAKMLILLGERCDNESLPDDIKVVQIQPPTRYGTHHSKISVIKYNGGVRIVVSTANLYADDWENRTQALWISPYLPKLPDNADKIEGESQTGFKDDFLSYLKNYGTRAQHWIEILERMDFSSVDVFFVASVPGNHKDGDRDRWGLRRLGVLLSQHAQLPADSSKWPVVAQSSSIGSLGANFDAWLGKEVVPTLSNEKKKGLKSAPKFQFIYPTINNFKNSFDMKDASCCLPYSSQLHAKQKWFTNYCHEWKSSSKNRDRAMPHVKSYTRISPDFKKIPWVVITSANLSKAAWGYGKNTNTILSYEAGVVFFPQFLINSSTFPINQPDNSGTPPFPMPYDVPLTPYKPDDEIFTMDFFNV